MSDEDVHGPVPSVVEPLHGESHKDRFSTRTGPRQLELRLALAADRSSRRPSVPIFLTAGGPPSSDFARRPSAQAEVIRSQAQRLGAARRVSAGRSGSGDGSDVSLHAIAERLSQPLPTRRCSLLDDRSRRLSRFQEPPQLADHTRKNRLRRATIALAIVLAIVAVALISLTLKMSTPDQNLSEDNSTATDTPHV